jgi:hypothetical protein
MSRRRTNISEKTERDYDITTQKDLRDAFWADHPNLVRRKGWTQNRYDATTRTAWCFYIEAARRDGTISAKLVERATL